MLELFSIFVFILGTIIGSFLNVVILRYSTGRNTRGRSFCFTCGKTLGALELIPVFSFLMLGGKCKKCNSRISLQYICVELLTGFLFLAVFLKFFSNIYTIPFFTLTYYFTLFSILVVIGVYDLKHKIVPDRLAFLFAGISLFGLLWFKSYDYLFSYPGFLDLLAGPIFFLPFYTLWRFSGGRLIGLGDGKLAIGIGWMLGLVAGTSAIILGFWIGAVFSLCLMFWGYIFHHKKVGLKTEIPFAPFLILGVLVAFMFDIDILSLGFLLSF
jgi:leader peptidase (prepilin peptidase) / N-methyltransferase